MTFEMTDHPSLAACAVAAIALALLCGASDLAAESAAGLEARMTALQAAPALRDGELFLIDGRAWVRSRGEVEFRQVRFEDPRDGTVARAAETGDGWGFFDPRADAATSSARPVAVDGRPLARTARACAVGFEDAAGDDPETADLPQVDAVPDDQVVLHENFESPFPGGRWLVGDDTTNVAHNYWGRVSCRRHYGSWSLWCAGDASPVTYTPFPCSQFPGDMRAYLVSAEAIDISHHSNVELSFWTWHETWSSDPLFVWVSPGSSEWVLLDVFWGSLDQQWREKRYLIEGFDTLELQIIFQADHENSGHEGVFLDDLLVSGCPVLGQASPTFPAAGEVLCEGDGRWFCWEEEPGASSYVVQWDDEPSFTWPYEQVTAIGTCYHRSLEGSGPRWWRVSARSSCSSGQWSAPRAVLLTAQPEPPNQYQPASGAVVCNTALVRYEWEDTAASYTVQWDDSSTFSSPVAEQTVTNPWAWQLLAGTGIRFWRVRAENGSCEADWSATRQVSLQPCGPIFTDGFESGGTAGWSAQAP